MYLRVNNLQHVHGKEMHFSMAYWQAKMNVLLVPPYTVLQPHRYLSTHTFHYPHFIHFKCSSVIACNLTLIHSKLQTLDIVVQLQSKLICAKDPQRKDFCAVMFPEITSFVYGSVSHV